jgi:hypothetical protein
MSASAAPKTIKMSILLDSHARVAAVSKQSDYRPAKDGDEPVVTVGLAAGPGQSVVEVEVPADLAGLDGHELLSRLAEHPSVQTVIASSPTAGEASFGSSQGLPTDVVTAGSL